jgi:hypothetical protein
VIRPSSDASAQRVGLRRLRPDHPFGENTLSGLDAALAGWADSAPTRQIFKNHQPRPSGRLTETVQSGEKSGLVLMPPYRTQASSTSIAKLTLPVGF